METLVELMEEETFHANSLREALSQPHKEAVKEAKLNLFRQIKSAVTDGRSTVEGMHGETDKAFWEALAEMKQDYGFCVEKRGWSHAARQAGWKISW